MTTRVLDLQVIVLPAIDAVMSQMVCDGRASTWWRRRLGWRRAHSTRLES